MDPHFAILQAVLIPLAVSIILPWIYGQSKKEETKNGVITRTKYPQRFTKCSLIGLIVTILLFVAGTMLLFVFEKDLSVYSWITFILSAILIISTPLLLTLLSICTYEIICDDGILIARLFRKRFVKYSEMASYRFSTNQLTVYDSKHNVIFGVYDNRVGMKSLLDQLEMKGIFRE